MKKFVLAILAVSTIATANAQKGTILGYGNLNFNTHKDAAKTTTSNFSIMPGVGYQFNNNWTVGLAGGYGSNVTKDSSGSKSTASNYQIGAFLRYTKNINSIFSAYGQLDVYYLGNSSKYTYGGTTIKAPKTTGFGASLTPAVAINIPKWFALNFAIGGIEFQSTKQNADNTLGIPSSTTSGFDFTFGKQFSIGISKNFGGVGNMHKHHKHHMDNDEDNDNDSMAPAHHKHHHKSKKAKNDDDDDE